MAVADPTFFAAVAVLDPAPLSTDLVAEAPLLSLLYLKYRGDQTAPSQYFTYLAFCFTVCATGLFNKYVHNKWQEFISHKL